jgi:hypothetical protein
MTLRKFILISTLFLFSSGLTFAQKPSKKEFTKRDEKMLVAVPPEFGVDNNEVLVCVLEGRKSFDKFLRKHIREQFKGKKVFIESRKIESELYNNIEKYRYVFKVKLVKNEQMRYNPNIVGGDYNDKMQRYNTRTYQFYILDRKTNSEYLYPKVHSNFGKLIKNYAMLLEKVRGSKQ